MRSRTWSHLIGYFLFYFVRSNLSSAQMPPVKLMNCARIADCQPVAKSSDPVGTLLFSSICVPTRSVFYWVTMATMKRVHDPATCRQLYFGCTKLCPEVANTAVANEIKIFVFTWARLILFPTYLVM